jgi:hypothetical protein
MTLLASRTLGTLNSEERIFKLDKEENERLIFEMHSKKVADAFLLVYSTVDTVFFSHQQEPRVHNYFM